MQEHLEIEVLCPFIAHFERCRQGVFGQSHTVDEGEFVRPGLAEVLAQQGMGQPEVQLHAQVFLVISGLSR